MDFSDPSWWVATRGVKHGDFVTFGEAFVDPFLEVGGKNRNVCCLVTLRRNIDFEF